MTKPSRKSLLSLFAAASMLLAVSAARQDAPADQRNEALKAIRDGDFDRANALLQKASSAGDAQAKEYAAWTAEFESQHEVFVAKRHKDFEKAIDDVRKLVAAGNDEVAIEFAALKAYVFAEDKQKFTDSDLVRGLIQRSADLAADHEAKGDWIKAQRLYSNISVLEPFEPKWKDHRETVARRVRILAMYCPDIIKAQRAEDAKLADEIDKILPPTTTRATRPTPTTAPADDDVTDSAFKIDWHDTLRGIKAPLLFKGLIEIRGNYWRELDFTKVIAGGISGVRTLVTTQGVTGEFPALKDEGKRAAFMARLDALDAELKGANKDTEVVVASQIYDELLKANTDTVKLPEEVVVFEFGDAALAQCDPFTNMIWPTELDEFKKMTQGEFFGVGISIRSDDDGWLKVASPLEDSPAYRAGIKAGDIITHVDGKAIKGITTTQAVKVITGKRGTPVTLTIKSFDGTVKDYTLIRDTIHVSSLKGFVRRADNSWDYFIDPENKIGYVRLTNFSQTSGSDLERATAELEAAGVRGIILDLRNNPGGLLTAAIDVVNRFIDHGLIVSTHPDRKTNQDAQSHFAHPEADGVKVPLVVMVNQFSASASEIVSGALKDQGRAIIVGERSFGKGSVQQLFQLGFAADNTVIKLTTAHYYLPSGRCLHRDEDSKVWGVDPDVKVEMTPEQMLLAGKALADFDVLHGKDEKIDPATKRTAEEMTRDLIKTDSQLGAALLLLRLQLHGAQVAVGNVAPGVAPESR
jgi:carboxyl-terminal processing protease